jgi:transcriptional antiterminator NusG
MSENNMKWYVVKTISGKEEKVKKYIQRELELNNMNKFVSQMLIPTEKVYQIKKGKKVNKERNFFPGYILLEANLFAELIHLIRNLTGVITFLGATRGGAPLPLRKQEVNRILGKVDELALENEEVNIPYVVGEAIKVIDGPFNGFNAVIEQINEEKRKLQVMVKIFGRKTPLELNYMQVDKV